MPSTPIRRSTAFAFFPGCTDGANPGGAFVADPQGNLYGTVLVGGANDLGAVYELTPPPGGSGVWTDTLLYSFCSQGPPCADGESPQTGVIRDANGNLYGTTLTGGSRSNEGTVFEVSPPQGGHGPWTETVLYAFCTSGTCTDGNQPLGGLTFDSHGNLYGTTTGGGPHGQGVVFELSPSGGGQWAYNILYGFCAQQGCADGRTPQYGSLVFDAAGNLYGTTQGGGSQNYGTVFELTPSGGSWTETVLHSFCSATNCTDGEEPIGGVVLDAHGNIYGVTPGGGTQNLGVAYELSQSGGSWTETVLQNFCDRLHFGISPAADDDPGRQRQSLRQHLPGRNASSRRGFRIEPDWRRPMDRDRPLQLLLRGCVSRWSVSPVADALRPPRQLIWRCQCGPVGRRRRLRVVAAPDSHFDHVDQRSESLSLWTEWSAWQPQ